MRDRTAILRDILPSAPEVLAPTDTLRQALGLLCPGGPGAAPVIATDGVCGIVSMTEIDAWRLRAGAGSGSTEFDLDGHTVEEVMTRRVLVLQPHVALTTALRTMHQLGVEHVVVMEARVCLGLISAEDVRRWTATEHPRDARGRIGGGEPT